MVQALTFRPGPRSSKGPLGSPLGIAARCGRVEAVRGYRNRKTARENWLVVVLTVVIYVSYFLPSFFGDCFFKFDNSIVHLAKKITQ